MLKLIPAATLLLASTAAFAQSGSTQSPPAPNSAASSPQPATSMPPGAANMNTGSVSNPNVSGPLSTTVVTPGASPMPMTAAPSGSPPMAATVPTPK